MQELAPVIRSVGCSGSRSSSWRRAVGAGLRPPDPELLTVPRGLARPTRESLPGSLPLPRTQPPGPASGAAGRGLRQSAVRRVRRDGRRPPSARAHARGLLVSFRRRTGGGRRLRARRPPSVQRKATRDGRGRRTASGVRPAVGKSRRGGRSPAGDFGGHKNLL